MFDLLTTIALHCALVVLFALILRHLVRRSVDFISLLQALGCVLVYFLAIMLIGGLQSRIPVLAGLQFNWSGKVIAIALTLAMMAAVPGATRQELGLTLRQQAGSIAPAILVTLALCAFAWGVRWALGGGATPSLETLAYQATMPGLDEELFFRGLLLALFLRAFGDRLMIAGAAMGPAAIAVTFLFAAGHALLFSNGALTFNAIYLGFSGVLGLGFIWIRQRTGSLLLPILAHNLINVGGSFLS